MSRRSWITLAVVVLLGIVTGWNVYVVAVQPCWAINRERGEQIVEGMSQEQVEVLLGRPPGNYTFFKYTTPRSMRSLKRFWLVEPHPWPSIGGLYEWESDRGSITAQFEDDKVTHVEFYDYSGLPGRDWLGILNRLLRFDRE